MYLVIEPMFPIIIVRLLIMRVLCKIPLILCFQATDGRGLVGNVATDRIYVSWKGHVQWVPEATYSYV